MPLRTQRGAVWMVWRHEGRKCPVKGCAGRVRARRIYSRGVGIFDCDQAPWQPLGVETEIPPHTGYLSPSTLVPEAV